MKIKKITYVKWDKETAQQVACGHYFILIFTRRIWFRIPFTKKLTWIGTESINREIKK